jgi:hypothetical protein
MRTPAAAATAVSAISTILALCAGVAGAAEDAPVPVASVRAFGGEAAGVGAQLWFAQVLRAELSAAALTVTSFEWASADAVARLIGAPRRFIGLRAGYQIEHSGRSAGPWLGSRTAHAFDVGLVGRLESLRGSALEAQVGVEEVYRSAAAVCCDDAALPRFTTGLRASLVGELAIWDELALFAQAELRTGAHVMESYWLPVAAIGARYRF